MKIKYRMMGALGLCGLLAYGGVYWSGPADGQVVLQQKAMQPGVPVPGQPKVPKIVEGAPLAAQFSAIKFQEKAEFRNYLNAARGCIKDKAWQEAVTALQMILDTKEDYYAQVTETEPSGRKIQRWISVKFEANHLLGSMPGEGLDVYEQRFGAPAKNLLQSALSTGNREILAEVAQRFLHTRAGIEANDLLATYFMDRGQFFMAALRFEKLFAMNPERVKIGELTLFKAALAYRRAGDVKNADAVWRKLEPRLRDQGGLKIGGEVVASAKLKEVIEETPPPENSGAFDWPYVGGNVTRSAQARGSPPLLDVVLFQRDLIEDKTQEDEKADTAKTRIEATLQKQNSLGNAPILPGFFPIASNNLLIYRSYYDIRAVFLQDEKNDKGEVVAEAGSLAWKSVNINSHGSLASLLDNPKTKTIDTWLTRFYEPYGFGSLVYENTLLGALSTDHKHAYAIDDIWVPCPGFLSNMGNWNDISQVGQDVKHLVMQNTLFACNLATGKMVWRLGPSDKDGNKDDPFAESHFLGVPISVGGKLYALNEKNHGPTGDSELRLICIDPNKLAGPYTPTIIEPIQPLGNVTQQNRITHDNSRRVQAVHLAYGEGILVCPTNAGEILGVDLLSRSLAWAYPYREEMPKTITVNNQPNINRGGFINPQMNAATLTQANWHSAPPVIQDGKVVFTAYDAASVHCINLRDGTPVWKKKQSENDLYLAGVFGGKVLIVGKSAIRALSLDDGRQLWYLPTGDLPSGQGVACNNIYYLPLKKGEILALDIDKGQVKAHNRAKSSNVNPGNLIFYEGAVISQTPTQIIAYPQLASRLQFAQAKVQKDPENPTGLIERGELYMADGQVRKAVEDLEKALARKPDEALANRAKRKLYEALTDLLTLDFLGSSGRYLDSYRDLCKVPGDPKEQQLRQARFFRIVGQGREAQGNLVEAFQMYREFGSLPIHRELGGVAALDDPNHKVPTNVWLRGRVGAMIAKATPEQRAPLEVKIAEEWKAVEAKKDIEAIRSFVGMFDVPFAVGREARLKLAETIIENNDRVNFLEAELNLLQLRGPKFKDDSHTGGRALAALAQLEEKKGSAISMKVAAAYYRQLKDEFGNVPVRLEKNGPRTGADLYNELAADPRFRPYLEEPGSPWANAKLAAREMGNPNFPVPGFLFQPQGDPSPALRHYRLNFDPEINSGYRNPQVRLVDPSTNAVRWSMGLGQVPANNTFYQYLYQQNQSNNAYYPDAHYRQYQVKGNLIVFQVASVVYCFDADNAKILWQHNLLEGSNLPGVVGQPISQHVLPNPDGFMDLVVTNNFNGQQTRSALGHVGAVEAAYVALVTKNGLLVLDPLRGTPLWKKTDVAAQTRVFGDEDHIFLVETSDGAAGSGRVLRAGDGMELAAPDFGAVYQQRVKVLGGRILAAMSGRDGLVLKLYDIVTGKDVWSKTYDPRTTVVRTEDPKITGVIDQAGTMVVLEAATGRELLNAKILQGRITEENLKGLKDPLLLHDAEHFFLALNKPVDAAKVAGGVLANNFNNGVRCLTVNGWFLAFHRQAGEKKIGDKSMTWKAGDLHWISYAPISNQLIVLEQFENLPILLFSTRFMEHLPSSGANRWVAVTQSIDRRSGKAIFDFGPKTFNSAIQFQCLNVDMKNATINMIGLNGNTIQHYIDDGRKPPDIAGINVGAVQSGAPIFRGADLNGLYDAIERRPVGGAIIIKN